MTTPRQQMSQPDLSYPRLKIQKSKYESVKWLIVLRMSDYSGVLISSAHPTAEIAWSMLESPQWLEYAQQVLEAEIAQSLPPLEGLDVHA